MFSLTDAVDLARAQRVAIGIAMVGIGVWSAAGLVPGLAAAPPGHRPAQAERA